MFLFTEWAREMARPLEDCTRSVFLADESQLTQRLQELTIGCVTPDSSHPSFWGGSARSGMELAVHQHENNHPRIACQQHQRLASTPRAASLPLPLVRGRKPLLYYDSCNRCHRQKHFSITLSWCTTVHLNFKFVVVEEVQNLLNIIVYVQVHPIAI